MFVKPFKNVYCEQFNLRIKTNEEVRTTVYDNAGLIGEEFTKLA